MIIGRHARVTKARNPSIIGTTGTITDETRNTMTITTSKGDRKLIKNQVEEIQ